MINKIKKIVQKQQLGSQKAQVLPYFFFMCIVLVLCWAMLINVAKLTTDRIIMQNAADNAALSAAVYKARVLNVLGAMNFAIGSYMYGPETVPFSLMWTYYKYVASVSLVSGIMGGPHISVPLVPMGGYTGVPHSLIKPPDSQKKIAGYLDTYQNGNTHIRSIKSMVDSLVAMQDVLMGAYRVNIWALATRVAKGQEKNAQGELCGPDYTAIIGGTKLGLERNKGAIYHTSNRVGVSQQVVKWAVNALLVIVLELPVVVQDIYEATPWSSGNKSWLYADKTVFDKSQKITVVCTKIPNSNEQADQPIFSKWFGIKWPSIETVASAGVYNTVGPMFPVSNGTNASDKISPVIKNYKKARKNGWDAHLIPVKKFGVQH